MGNLIETFIDIQNAHKYYMDLWYSELLKTILILFKHSIKNKLIVILYSILSYFWNFSGLDYEYSAKGITVQCLCPGPVATDMVSGILKGGVISKGIFNLFPRP